MSGNPEDLKFMRQAIDIAARGKSGTHPNPRVGCVMVKDSEVVGRGWHRLAGQPHAEIEALNQAGDAARDATAYVNLEPCCHQGRTPPCTDAMILNGVTRVVASMADPNPQVSGGGFQILREAGVDVEVGLLEAEARWINRGFLKRMLTGLPWVRAKIGATLDGRTATASGESQWITGEAARADVQQLRANSSAVLTGIGTVLADDPRMNVRLDDAVRQPLRVIVDSQLRLPDDASIIGDDGLTLLFTATDRQPRVDELQAHGVEVVAVAGDDGRADLRRVLEELAVRECNEVLVECGATLAGQLLRLGLVDELVVYFAASVLGGSARGMFDIGGIQRLDDRIHFEFKDLRQIGSDVRLITVNPASSRAIGIDPDE